ncbi:MAG: hypothetical protein M3Y59_21240, partial [Myxococcota bacterium]|nr:hypothetical protein [Myxococcota bacterium]
SQVMSAARVQPTGGGAGDLKQKLRAGAEDTALNVLGAARDTLADFTRSSIYFKYKVLIAALWAVAMSGTLFVACPSNPLSASNDLGAVLVIAGDKDRPVFMVKNESEDTWQEVMLVVDKQYRVASPQVAPGGNFTVTPRQLVGANNTLAPPDLRPRHMELRTADGDEVLMQDGQPQ